MRFLLAAALTALAACAGEPLRAPVSMPAPDSPAIGPAPERGFAATLVPHSAWLHVGRQQRFQLVVQGFEEYSVRWSVDGDGSVEAGVYRAPPKAPSRPPRVVAEVSVGERRVAVLSAAVTILPGGAQ